MVIEIIRYSLSAGQEADFETAYEKAQQYLAESSHCLGYELIRSVEEPNRYILRIEWDSVDGDGKGFRESPKFAEFFKLTSPFFNAIDEMQHYEKTQIIFKAERKV